MAFGARLWAAFIKTWRILSSSVCQSLVLGRDVVREDFGSMWLFLNCRSKQREKYVVISLKGAQQQDIPTEITL